MTQGSPDAGNMDFAAASCPPFPAEFASCTCSIDDYAPRFNKSTKDTWAACISDGNEYKLAGANPPGSASRTLSFDAMGAQLWKNPMPPTQAEFVNARDIYAIANGIGSRVSRRQDIHYPEIQGAMSRNLACTEGMNATMYPDRCVGPGRLVPIINDAFTKGIAQMEPRVQAARVEAALLWFFYASVLSEVWTCSFVDKADCDSSWAYYNAAQTRDMIAGPSGYIRPLSQETHDRIFDGLLASRCWRDLDQALPATNTMLYDRAQAQIDKALLKGMALILKDRLGKVMGAAADVQKAHLTFINMIGGYMDRAARAKDATKADLLKAQVSATDATKLNVKAAQDLLDQLFACP